MDVSRRDFLRFSVAAGGEGKSRALHEADPGRSHASRAWIDGITRRRAGMAVQRLEFCGEGRVTLTMAQLRGPVILKSSRLDAWCKSPDTCCDHE